MIEDIYRTNGARRSQGSYVHLSSHEIALRMIDGGTDSQKCRHKQAEITSVTSLRQNPSNSGVWRCGSGPTYRSKRNVATSSSRLPSITKFRPESTGCRYGGGSSSSVVIDTWDSVSQGGSCSSLSGDEREKDIGALQGSQANLFRRPLAVQNPRSDAKRYVQTKKKIRTKKKKHKEVTRDVREAPELHHSGLTMDALNELHSILDDPEYRHEDMIILPVVCGPVCSFNQKARKRLLALELLLKQLPNLKSQITTGKDPLCAVGGQYLSLSARNIETLVDMMKSGNDCSDLMRSTEAMPIRTNKLLGAANNESAGQIPKFLKGNKSLGLRPGQRSPLATNMNGMPNAD
ncbi:uncharacterized protein LOC141902050 [Tubulanus polymorphus]|uniref:uncharacterized protein LOC141902050 n=1 Tax=Tubulanus polymorphus TaxID=672921 RepID=UPI003DA2F46B